jgi:hypothetical protein
MPHFRLTYKLTGAGWAEAEVSDGVEQLHITVSYIGPGIEAAADAAIALLQGAEHAEFEWWDEPGCAQWLLEKQGDQLQIVLVIWDDWIEGPRRKMLKRYVISVTSLKFAIQVWDALRHLLEEHGADGYAKEWRYPFPLDEYQMLDQLIREAKRAAREERKAKEQHSN